MTKDEFKKIALAISTAYPNTQAFNSQDGMNIWYMMLSDLDYNIVQPAVLEHISTNKFPPSIAEIREKCTTYTSLPTLDWGEAWERVLYAIRKFGYMDEFGALNYMDEITRKCVKRIGYMNICTSENITADRANFRMIYEQEVNKRKTEGQLPLQLRTQKQQMISKLVESTTSLIEG